MSTQDNKQADIPPLENNKKMEYTAKQKETLKDYKESPIY